MTDGRTEGHGEGESGGELKWISRSARVGMSKSKSQVMYREVAGALLD